MKTYEEMAQSALRRIDRYEAEQKKRRKAAARIAAPVMSFCLVAIIGLGAWHAGVFEKAPESAFSSGPDIDASGMPVPNPDGTIQREKEPEVYPQHPILHPGDEGYVAPVPTPDPDNDIDTAPAHTETAPAVPDEVEPPEPEIITGGDGQKGGGSAVTGGFCEFWWKNKLVMYGDLYWALDENPGGTFAILAAYRPTPANVTDFTYEGKTLSEWAIAADEERLLPEKMVQLLKCGDELKYGPALYETGTPDGYKWDKNYYEEQVAWFGDLLDKYIVDGEFLRAALEADIAALTSITVTTPDGTTTVNYSGATSARKQYSLAYNAYLETVLPAAAEKLTASGIPCQRAPYRTDALIFTATAAQLESLPLDDLGSWHFSLNSGDHKGASAPAVDDTGLQVVN